MTELERLLADPRYAMPFETAPDDGVRLDRRPFLPYAFTPAGVARMLMGVPGTAYHIGKEALETASRYTQGGRSLPDLVGSPDAVVTRGTEDYTRATEFGPHAARDALSPTGLGFAGIGATAAREAVPAATNVLGNWPKAVRIHNRFDEGDGFRTGLGMMGVGAANAAYAASINPLFGLVAASAPIGFGATVMRPHWQHIAEINRRLGAIAERDPARRVADDGMTLYADSAKGFLPGTIVQGMPAQDSDLASMFAQYNYP